MIAIFVHKVITLKVSNALNVMKNVKHANMILLIVLHVKMN